MYYTVRVIVSDFVTLVSGHVMCKNFSRDPVIHKTMAEQEAEFVYLSGFKVVAFFSFLLPGCVISGRLWRESDKIKC